MLFDPKELNYSKIRTYRECPRLYHIIYVEQKRQPLTPLSSLGISLHRALDAYHRNGKEMEELLDALDASWVAAGYADAQEQMVHYKRGRQLLEDYWAADMARDSTVRWTEKTFEFPAEEFRIKGTIDRVDHRADGSWEVIDYKTGPEPIDEAAMPGLQLTIYGAGLQNGLNLPPSILSYWHLCSGKKYSAPFDKNTAEQAVALFVETGRKILAEEFPKNEGRCAQCLLRGECVTP